MDHNKAVLIIAKETFRDEELFDTQKALEEEGVETTVASSVVGNCKGKLGQTARSTILVKDISADDYDAVIFVGGSGAMQYYDDSAALSLAKQADKKCKVIAAICIAPRILANADLLKGKTATCYVSEAEAIRKLGANYTGSDVEQDGKTITANGPHAAYDFGKKIANELNKTN